MLNRLVPLPGLTDGPAFTSTVWFGHRQFIIHFIHALTSVLQRECQEKNVLDQQPERARITSASCISSMPLGFPEAVLENLSSAPPEPSAQSLRPLTATTAILLFCSWPLGLFSSHAKVRQKRNCREKAGCGSRNSGQLLLG